MDCVGNFKRLFSKICREIYRLIHPAFWGRRLQINGIPRVIGESNLSLGYDVSINEDVYIQCSGGVFIGDRVTLSRGVTILTASLATKNYKSNSSKRYREHITKTVHIGNGTWIAANVTICPGSVVGENCIVAAGAVVNGLLTENDCLYAGVPARQIKSL